jgi:hypothetical protein
VTGRAASGGARRALVRAACLGLVALPLAAGGHDLAGSDARYLEALAGPAFGPFLYLGAQHMVTGLDHLLYLLGVLFFLSSARDVVLYVSLFAVGHSITLLCGVLADLQVNAAVVDALIGLSVVYKAFENLGGFEDVFGAGPDPRAAVLVFGLCHGLGLATKLQTLALAEDGLVLNLVSFNVGVEVGQLLALAAMLALLLRWRAAETFAAQARTANFALMVCGFTLAGMHLTGLAL